MNGGIVTECPECETRFNVSEGQLRLASGKVRCGACLRVFDARSHQPYSGDSRVDIRPATPPAPANQTPQPDLSRTDSSSRTAMEPTTLRTDRSTRDQPAAEPSSGHHRYAQTRHPVPPFPPPAEPSSEPASASTAESKRLPDSMPGTRPTPWFDFEPDAPLFVSSEPEHSDSNKHGADTPPADLPQWTPAARHGQGAARTFSGPQSVPSSAQVVPIRPNIRPAAEPQYKRPAEHTHSPTQATEPQYERPAEHTHSPTQATEPQHERPAEHTHSSAHAAEPQYERPAEHTHSSAHAAEPDQAQTAPEKPSLKQAQAVPLPLIKEQPASLRAAAVEHSLQEADPGRFHFERQPDTALQRLPTLHDLHAEPMELLHPLEPVPPAAIMGWSLGCVAASVLLATQLLWFNRIDWSQQPQLTGFYQILCNQVDCAIPPRQAVDLIRNHQLVVRAHPRFSDALSIDLLLENTADFRQPFPAIELNFTDIRGRTVARRLLQPSDYLDTSLDPLNMPYAQPFQVNLSLLDPGQRAVSYEVQLAPASL